MEKGAKMISRILASAVVATVGSVTVAQAMPVEFAFGGFLFEHETTFNDMDGTYDFMGTGIVAAAVDPDFTTPDVGRYIFEYGYSINDEPEVEGEFDVVLTEAETDALIFEALGFAALINDNRATPVTLPGGLGTVTYDFAELPAGTPFTGYEFSVAGTFTQSPDDVLQTFFADELAELAFFIPDAADFSLNAESGSIEFFAVASIAPVPLPASMPLMAIGLGGLVVLRRRRTSKQH